MSTAALWLWYGRRRCAVESRAALGLHDGAGSADLWVKHSALPLPLELSDTPQLPGSDSLGP